MNNRVLVLIKGPLERAVPILSIAQHLRQHSFNVKVGCSSCDSQLKSQLAEAGISVNEYLDSSNQSKGVLSKVYEWASFRSHAKKDLNASPDWVYVGSADSAIVLRGLLPNGRYILHLRELHDAQPVYMKLLKTIGQNAHKVVVPEINRAQIYRVMLELDQIPIVIPNKPYVHPGKSKLPIKFLPQEIRHRLETEDCIIYQGPLHEERDLSLSLSVISEKTKYTAVIMGRDYGLLDKYLEIDPEIIYIPFVVPPLHLHVTSWAKIGIIMYDYKSLNTVFCAPNKVWEYGGFGLPMLCNDNLGLQYSVGGAGAAVRRAQEHRLAPRRALGTLGRGRAGGK